MQGACAVLLLIELLVATVVNAAAVVAAASYSIHPSTGNLFIAKQLSHTIYVQIRFRRFRQTEGLERERKRPTRPPLDNDEGDSLSTQGPQPSVTMPNTGCAFH